MTDDPYDVEFGSDQCNALLELLNKTTVRPDASFKVDMMSGAYKFSDEFPDLSADDSLLFPLVNLLRMLWAFRISLVRKNPRIEYEHWWELVRTNAPNWAGFASDRCTAAALPYAKECSLRCRTFDTDIDELERSIKKQN